ncbi:MAG: hypothetical protein ACC660_06740 [Acidimicrobiales bacterium]
MTRRRVCVTAAVWIVLSVSLWASDSSPAVLVLGGIVAVIAASVYVTLDLAKAIVPVEWPTRQVASPSRRADKRRLSRLRSHVQYAAWTDSTYIHDTLVELVDDRLLAHHRVDRAASPEAAMSLLTPTLRRVVAGPYPQVAAPRELRRILSDIEVL